MPDMLREVLKKCAKRGKIRADNAMQDGGKMGAIRG